MPARLASSPPAASRPFPSRLVSSHLISSRSIPARRRPSRLRRAGSSKPAALESRKRRLFHSPPPPTGSLHLSSIHFSRAAETTRASDFAQTFAYLITQLAASTTRLTTMNIDQQCCSSAAAAACRCAARFGRPIERSITAGHCCRAPGCSPAGKLRSRRQVRWIWSN